ncbi:Uncharacterized protein APZ42_029721 [Daphnia magna]|uniref:Uncharacterized protein n=1 Tax=Daphnia magna TaxID=35525 RepID=A0A164PDJ8_9CRUS|nr:Uncharacterized protein APZ42_029721 [Daphnia magna]
MSRPVTCLKAILYLCLVGLDMSELDLLLALLRILFFAKMWLLNETYQNLSISVLMCFWSFSLRRCGGNLEFFSTVEAHSHSLTCAILYKPFTQEVKVESMSDFKSVLVQVVYFGDRTCDYEVTFQSSSRGEPDLMM